MRQTTRRMTLAGLVGLARALVAHLRSLRPIRFQTPKNVGPNEKAPAPYLSIVSP